MDDTLKYMALTREQRLNESGDQPPCPFCLRPRVTRSTYIRCNPCGVNWSTRKEDEEDISKDPRLSRPSITLIMAIKPPNTVTNDGAATARPSTKP